MMRNWTHRTALVPAVFVVSTLAAREPSHEHSLPKKNKELNSGIRIYLDTAKAGSFRAFADAIDPQTNPPVTVPRLVSDRTKCDQGKHDAVVTLTAANDSHMLSHKGTFRHDQQSHTWVLARIDVVGCDFTDIGLTRGRRAYWVVEPDDDDLI